MFISVVILARQGALFKLHLQKVVGPLVDFHISLNVTIKVDITEKNDVFFRRTLFFFIYAVYCILSISITKSLLRNITWTMCVNFCII